MKLFGKIAIVTGAAVGIIFVTKKVVTKKYTNLETENISAEEKKEDPSVFEKIKKYVAKKVDDILMWVVLHKDKVDAISCLVGLAAGVFEIAHLVKDFKATDKMQEQLNRIERSSTEGKQREYLRGYGDGYHDQFSKALDEMTKRSRDGESVKFYGKNDELLKEFKVMEVVA